MTGAAKLKEMGLVPLVLRLDAASAYVGLSRRSFLAAVDAGTYPQPLPGKGPKRWNRVALEAAHGVKAEGENSIMGALDEACARLRGEGKGVQVLPARKGQGATARGARQS